MPENLYAHFPFCRRKCAYCALYSRTGVPADMRDAYVRRMADEISARFRHPLKTVYFGGGSPALCDLRPVFAALAPLRTADTEFTVELHPLDVTPERLSVLRAGGVNRISMGVQSLDDATLERMGRGYTARSAFRAFAAVRKVFDNAGIDLIVGFPGDPGTDAAQLADWGLAHCSAYAIQNERGLAGIPADDELMDRLRRLADGLGALGLSRYEISNYALPGRECRHNLAVWRGEDYAGLGAGACGREGRMRTQGRFRDGQVVYGTETVTPEADRKERLLFRLRTRDGLDASNFPDERSVLDRFAAEGLLAAEGGCYRLTARGAEVCDTILAELV